MSLQRKYSGDSLLALPALPALPTVFALPALPALLALPAPPALQRVGNGKQRVFKKCPRPYDVMRHYYEPTME